MTTTTEKENATFEELLTVSEFAERVMHCSQSMLWKLIREGSIPVVRNGRLIRIQPKRALDAYVQKFTKLARK
jgi:excisionase family DNA binding protein